MPDRKLILRCCLLIACGCSSPAPAEPSPGVAAPAPAPAPVEPAKRAAPATRAPPAMPLNAEVEFAGELIMPKNARGAAKVYVLDGRCFAHTSLALAVVAVSATGRYGGEIYVPQHTPLWFCGALEVDGEIVLGGSASEEPFLAEGRGEVYAPHAKIALAKLSPPAKPPQRLDLTTPE